MKLRQLDEQRWEIAREGGMRVPGIVYASRAHDARAARRPGAGAGGERGAPAGHRARVARHARHPLGLRLSHRRRRRRSTPSEGVVSPGGVGYDINCGVRLLRPTLVRRRDPAARCASSPSAAARHPGRRRLAAARSAQLDAGETRAGARKMAQPGRSSAGFGTRRRSRRAPRRAGGSTGPSPTRVSETALASAAATSSARSARATTSSRSSASTRSSTSETARRVRAASPGSSWLLIHSGSRGPRLPGVRRLPGGDGRGHGALRHRVPDRQLACAPVESPEGQRYLGAMAAAANFAWANRQTMMAHWRRAALARVLGIVRRELGTALVYDVVPQHRQARAATSSTAQAASSARVRLGFTAGRRLPRASGGPAGDHPRRHGTRQLRARGHRARHGGDVRLELPRRRAACSAARRRCARPRGGASTSNCAPRASRC